MSEVRSFGKGEKGQARFSPDSTFVFLLSLTRRRLSLRNLAVDFITTWKVTGAMKVMGVHKIQCQPKLDKRADIANMSVLCPHIPIAVLICWSVDVVFRTAKFIISSSRRPF